MTPNKKSKNKKNIFLWALYNFANTPVTIAMGGLFLAQWVVIDNKVPDIWYSATYTLATILLLITSPFFGAWSDKVGKRTPFLKWTSYLQMIVGVVLGIVAVSNIQSTARVFIVLILFFFLQYFYQISLIFYNAILDLLSTSKNIGKISGITNFTDALGWLLGPAILLPFSLGYITLFGQPGRGQVFLPAMIIFAITGLPMLFWFKEPMVSIQKSKTRFSDVYKNTINGLVSLIKKDKNVTRFLLSFMFISDALLTANLYFAIYLDQIYKIGDTEKYIALAIMEIVSLPSAYYFGKLADKIGQKKVLVGSCLVLTLSYSVLSMVSSLGTAFVLSGLAGLGYGGFYTTSMAMLTKISPKKRLGEYFGFYSTFQKFASIIGPMVYGIITLSLVTYGLIRYRVAFFTLSMLMLIGTLILLKVKEEKSKI